MNGNKSTKNGMNSNGKAIGNKNSLLTGLKGIFSHKGGRSRDAENRRGGSKSPRPSKKKPDKDPCSEYFLSPPTPRGSVTVTPGTTTQPFHHQPKNTLKSPADTRAYSACEGASGSVTAPRSPPQHSAGANLLPPPDRETVDLRMQARKAAQKVRARQRHNAESTTGVAVDNESVDVPSLHRSRDISPFYDMYEHERRPRSSTVSTGGAKTELLVMRKGSRPREIRMIAAIDRSRNPYMQYLRSLRCYDLLPETGSVIMLDVQLSVQRAFMALLDSPDRVGIVYDMDAHDYAAVLSQSDFLAMLHYSHLKQVSNWPSKSLSWWVHLRRTELADTLPSCVQLDGDCEPPADRPAVGKSAPRRKNDRPAGGRNKLVVARSDQNLESVVQLLSAHHVHRAIVLTDGNATVAGFIGAKRILAAVQKQLRSFVLPAWMLLSAEEAKLGTWTDDVKRVSLDSALWPAVDTMLREHLSSLLVTETLDPLAKVVDILTKEDVVFLVLHVLPLAAAAGKSHEFESSSHVSTLGASLSHATVADALAAREKHQVYMAAFRRVTHSGAGLKRAFIRPTDTIVTIIDKLVLNNVRCVYVLDQQMDNRCRGAISIADVLHYLLKIPDLDDPSTPLSNPLPTSCPLNSLAVKMAAVRLHNMALQHSVDGDLDSDGRRASVDAGPGTRFRGAHHLSVVEDVDPEEDTPAFGRSLA